MNASIPSSSLAIPTIPIDHIAPSPSNPRKRFDETYLQELAASLREHGMIQPITVRPLPLDHLFEYNRMNPPRGPDDVTPTYEIVVGECRWRAARLAGLTEVPAFWRNLDDKQVLEIQVIENLQRRDVHPLEEADGYRQLIDKHGYRAEDIAEKIGKSRSYVFGRMKLSSLGSKGRELFYAGRIEASVALLIARIPDEKDQQRALTGLTNNFGDDAQITFRDAQYRIRSGFTRDLCFATWPLGDSTLWTTAGSCVDCPKRSGNSPELCPDLTSPDICTDLKCFEEKRLARREQLIDNASQRGITVYVGEAVKAVAPSGTSYSLDEKWENIDGVIAEDPQQRTWRDLLGDQTPVTMMAEFGNGPHAKIESFAEDTVLAEALKKAGIDLPSYGGGDDDAEDLEQELAAVERRERQNAEDDQLRRMISDERGRRKAVLQGIKDKLASDNGDLNTDPIIVALAMAQLRLRVTYDGFDCDYLREFGIEVPDPFDEDVELARATVKVLMTWTVSKALAFLIEISTQEEVDEVYDWREKSIVPTPSLDALAQSLGISATYPADAAQASGALREEKQAEAHELWPFPTLKNETKQNPIETNEKPKGRSKAKAKAVA